VGAGVVFRGTNLWILIFAILIASLGLNVNSTAVIIGAMLVSPLMGPIIGLGVGVGIGDFDLLRRALKNYGIAVLISVLTATIYFLLSPLSEARSELLARTSPSLYDVLIAFFGGAAGVLALTTKSKGQVIPGVAIATALMPPLCTAGYGLATAQWNYFFGALYLFFINTVFIAVATFIGVKLLRFHTLQSTSPERARNEKRLVSAVVFITLLPAAFMTVGIVRQEVTEQSVKKFIENEVAQNGTKILSAKAEGDTINIVTVGRVISDDELSDARRHLSLYGLKDYSLSIIQGGSGDQVLSVTKTLTDEITLLERQLEEYTRYDTLSAHIAAEAEPLFPWVESVAVGRVDGEALALVRLNIEDEETQIDFEPFYTWLRIRTDNPGLEVIIR